MRWFLIIAGIIGPYFMIRYREQIGNSLGEATWMRSFGGIYGIIVFVAIFIFFWAIAELTGTTDVLFAPLKWLIPGLNTVSPQQELYPI